MSLRTNAERVSMKFAGGNTRVVP